MCDLICACCNKEVDQNTEYDGDTFVNIEGEPHWVICSACESEMEADDLWCDALMDYAERNIQQWRDRNMIICNKCKKYDLPKNMRPVFTDGVICFSCQPKKEEK